MKKDNIYTLISKLKKKQIEPKLYVFNFIFKNNNEIGREISMLSSIVEYSYEEALLKTKTQFIEELTKSGIHLNFFSSITVSVWNSYNLLSLFDGFIEEKVEKIEKTEEREYKKIETNNLLNLIKENKNRLTLEEKQYIKNIL